MSTSEDPPWADVEPTEPDWLIEDFADDWDKDVDAVRDQLKRSRWLEDQDLETVLQYELADRLVEVTHDTPRDHNVHVVLDFEEKPGDIVIESGFDAWLDWFIDCRRAIEQYTDWEITNKRVREYQKAGVDQQALILTLRPE